jgi:glycosyltransferase involved in cell wall biosynthesis
VKVLVFLSFKYSFQTWKVNGTFNREILVYEKLAEIYNINFVFISYGNERDIEIVNKLNNPFFEVIPIFTIFKETNNKLRLFFYSFFIVLKLPELFKAVDLVKYIQLSGSWNSIIIKLIYRTPIYIKTGFDTFLFSVKEKRGKIKSVLFYLLTYLGLFNSSIYAASSESDIKVLKKIYPLVRHSKIVLRPNWVNIINLEDVKTRDKKSILLVGRLEEQKNYDFIIDTFQNTHFKIHIIGSGSLKEELLKLAKDKNCEVRVTNNLDHFELLHEMRKYEYFILASKFEGNPKVLIEAVSSGCVPLVSNIPNNKEIVKDGVNGHTFKLNDTGKEKILRVLSNYSSDENSKMRKEGRKIIKENFSLENYVKFEFQDYMTVKKN